MRDNVSMGGYYTVILVFLISRIPQTYGVTRILTFMTVKQTWNEASLVCNMKGGYLYKDGSAAISAQVGVLADLEPWTSQGYLNDDFWIGLGYNGTSDANGDPIYIWNSDCVSMNNTYDYSDWHPSEPKFPTTNECIYRNRATGNSNWFTSKCSTDKYYICQTEAPDPCNKTYINDSRGSGLEDELYHIVTLDFCDTRCNNTKCVAYAYQPTTQICYIYIYYDILHFNDPLNRQNDPGCVLYLKGCFEAAVDNANYAVSNGNFGVDVQCSALADPITTASVPATTAIATTTTTALSTSALTSTARQTTTSTTPLSTMTTATTLIPSSVQETTTQSLSSTATALPITSSMNETTQSQSTTTTQRTTNINTVTANLCQCTCTVNQSASEEDVLQRIMSLHSKLAVNKRKLSSTIRRLSCASDTRASAAALGVLGSLLLIFCVSAVILADVRSICVAAKTCKSKPKKHIVVC